MRAYRENLAPDEQAQFDRMRAEDAEAPRQFVNFAFYKLDPLFRRELSEAERSDAACELAEVVESAQSKFLLYPYSTLGIRPECDFMLWRISYRIEDFEEMTTALLRTRMGQYLSTPYSYLAMTKTSIYVDEHDFEDREGGRKQIVIGGGKYLFVYPFVKTRAWYRLTADERRRAMREHITVGHEYPSIKLNTTYSFGLDDQEFVVAFESDYPQDFLDLVHKLRESEASAYTERDVPVFTCLQQDMATILKHVGGVK